MLSMLFTAASGQRMDGELPLGWPDMHWLARAGGSQCGTLGEEC